MSDDLVKRLRGIDKDLILRREEPPMSFDGLTAHQAANRIETLERLEKQMPAIIEYLEQQADVVDGDNGIPHPNKAMTLLVWLRHELEGKDD